MSVTQSSASSIIETINGLDEAKKAEYKTFYNNTLKKFGASSIKKLSKNSKEKFFQHLKDNWGNPIQETSASGAAGEYLTPNVFSDGSDGAKKKQKSNAELLGMKLAENDKELKESFYFKDDTLTAEQKMNLAVRQIRNNLYEVEKLVGKTLKLKNESGVRSEEYGKRTYAALRKINEKVIRLMGSIQNFK